MKYYFALLFAVSLLSCAQRQSMDFQWISTTETSPWTEVTDKAIPVESDTVISINIDFKSKKQTIDGFGGCFNELGYDALMLLQENDREDLLRELFSTEGHNFTIGRMPIGANDYARDWYSLNDTPGDLEMTHFNIDRDKTILIPYIKMAMKYNPTLRIWGSPWCPPAWMKINNHYACSPDSTYNDLKVEQNGKEMVNQFRMEPAYLQAYALYFSKYIKAYRKEGINVYAVHVQNEPNSCQKFPSCIWTPGALSTFIGEYLGPMLEKDSIDAEIWYGTIERPFISHIDTMLTNPSSAKYVHGLGFQWAGRDVIPEANAKYPEIKKMQTETECGDGSNDWAAAEHTCRLIHHYLNNGANAYMYWNIILDETGISRWGWVQNSMISVNPSTKTYRLNMEYYLMKHLSHFVKPGAVMVSADSHSDQVLAFENADGSKIVFFSNLGESARSIELKIGETSLKLTAQANSLNTIKLDPNQN